MRVETKLNMKEPNAKPHTMIPLTNPLLKGKYSQHTTTGTIYCKMVNYKFALTAIPF
jgi:hypothetical protein